MNFPRSVRKIEHKCYSRDGAFVRRISTPPCSSGVFSSWWTRTVSASPLSSSSCDQKSRRRESLFFTSSSSSNELVVSEEEDNNTNVRDYRRFCFSFWCE